MLKHIKPEKYKKGATLRGRRHIYIYILQLWDLAVNLLLCFLSGLPLLLKFLLSLLHHLLALLLDTKECGFLLEKRHLYKNSARAQKTQHVFSTHLQDAKPVLVGFRRFQMRGVDPWSTVQQRASKSVFAFPCLDQD